MLFGPPGHAYVYFIYGMYYCLNVSCEPDGRAGGVLFRALEPICGIWQSSTNGPGRLCRAMGITRERDNGTDLTSPDSDLQIQDDGFVAGDILVTPRIGISKDAERLARYILAGNPFVSKRGALILTTDPAGSPSQGARVSHHASYKCSVETAGFHECLRLAGAIQRTPGLYTTLRFRG